MKKTGFLYKAFDLYYEGFRSMTLGRTLWAVILIKLFIMVVVLMATLLDTAIGNASRVFQTAATMYYIANEGISILENTARMGVAYPAVVVKALETLREKGEGEIGNRE